MSQGDTPVWKSYKLQLGISRQTEPGTGYMKSTVEVMAQSCQPRYGRGAAGIVHESAKFHRQQSLDNKALFNLRENHFHVIFSKVRQRRPSRNLPKARTLPQVRFR